MVTERCRTHVRVDLDPIWQDQPPLVQVRLDNHQLWHDALRQRETIEMIRDLPRGQHCLEIELRDKPAHDPIQAVRIHDLVFGGIRSAKFVWQGVYRPIYPEPWASQQQALGLALASEVRDTDCLGWNGCWVLEFTVPVFTWIHQVEDLGWIYD